MDEERARKIYEAYKDGAKVMINSIYVDEFARLSESDGEVYISSHVWCRTKLTELGFPVIVYKELEI